MGIVNVTPDSFSGDGLAGQSKQILLHAERLLNDGAEILDIGAESTRPGALPVSVEDELARLLPVLKKLISFDIPISIDTYKPEVMRAALDLGVDMINDISGLNNPLALQAVAEHKKCAVCLMHMQGRPHSMQIAPNYTDVMAEVTSSLIGKAEELGRVGVNRNRVILDPGFGFGKTLEQNINLFRGLGDEGWQNYPLLVGVSRKSMIGALTGKEVNERMPGSIVAAVMAIASGAKIVRVHDVAQTKDALMVWEGLR